MENRILVPIITPFNEDESINHEVLAALTKKVIADGADGIYATGSSAECFLLTPEERMSALETIIKAADGAYVVAHVGNVGTKTSIELAKHAQKAGADAIASVPPFYFAFGFEEVKSYYRDLSQSVSIPTMMYNLPSSTGVSLSISQLTEIMNLPSVKFMKFTDTNYYVMEQVHSDSGKFMYSGKDECFLSAIAAGADGGIGTTYNFMVGKYLRIYEAYKQGKMDEALRIQQSANRMTRACVENGCLPATKYILSLQGIDVGECRRPFASLTDAQKEYIRKVYLENIDI